MRGASGLTPARLKQIRRLFESALAGGAPVKVYLFGSRARGDHKQYSDADLLIEGTPDERRLRELKSALAESDLPFKCDVVTSRDIYEPYRARIESEKKLIFALNET